MQQPLDVVRPRTDWVLIRLSMAMALFWTIIIQVGIPMHEITPYNFSIIFLLILQ